MPELDIAFYQWLVDTRREFHRHPEIQFKEIETTRRIREILDGLDIENTGFDDMTGAVGLIRGGKPGKTIGLRADIDALPILEQTDVPFKSRTPGMMHACGHDAHTTIMLGVAKYLVESGRVKEMAGNVKLLFEPAEEGDGGADPMIKKGALEDPHVDRVLACHVAPNLKVGTAGLFRSQSHASTDPFQLVIEGKSGHGGHPHEAVDPIVAGAYFITALQTIVARNVNPLDTAVVHIGRFVAGEAGNAVPPRAELAGGVRALNPEVREVLLKRLQEIISGLETGFGVKCRLKFLPGYPPCINDTEVSAFLHEIGSRILGEENISWLQPSTGAEDFSFFTKARPGAMIMLGCRNEEKDIVHPLHSALFNLDEQVLSVGVRIFSEAVCRFCGC